VCRRYIRTPTRRRIRDRPIPNDEVAIVMRGILLWLIGIPIPIIILLWLFGVF
jgi:hypothetical protein